VNNDQRLSTKEFGDLLMGHELLTESINQALEAADGDGDGHLHLEELAANFQGLLESEFVEEMEIRKCTGGCLLA